MQGNPPLGGGAHRGARLPPALRLEEKLRVLEVDGDGQIVSSPWRLSPVAPQGDRPVIPEGRWDLIE